jgi:methionine-rich copper-binding protein CopC
VSSGRTWLARLAIGVVIAGAFSIGAAVPASAHDVLISSDPADGSTVRSALSMVSFTFDQPVANVAPVISLIGPGGKQYAAGMPKISGNVVTGDVAQGPAGAYTAAYRFVSADGHPVSGEVRFTLAASGATESGGAVTDGATAPSSARMSVPVASAQVARPTDAAFDAAVPATKGDGLSVGIWIGLVAAVLVIAAAAVVLLRRPPDKDH